MGGIKSVAQGMATKGGKIGAIGEAGLAGTEALEAASGPVGWVALAGTVAYQGANFIAGKVTDQRAQNAAYQDIYGGTNMAGMGQRFLQAGYSMGQLFSGGMTPGMSAQAFKGVSAMGYQGTARQQRLDFVSSNYKSMGMSVDESMQLIQSASQNLTTSLGDLHKQLQQVTKTAQETGQSAQIMRQSFVQNFGVTSGAGAGLGAGALATGITATSGLALGRQFAGTSTAGMLGSLQQQAITGVYAGYTNPGQFMADVGKNPVLGANAMDKRIGAMLQGIIPADVRSRVEAAIKKAGGPQELTKSGGQNIAMQIAVDPAVGLTQVPAMALDQVLTMFGIQHDPNNSQAMYGLLVNLIGQQMPQSPTSNTAVTAAAAAKTKEQSTPTTGKDLVNSIFNKGTSPGSFQYGQRQARAGSGHRQPAQGQGHPGHPGRHRRRAAGRLGSGGD